jgi:Mlc titration factor MtfA (ptsG expression regulator)
MGLLHPQGARFVMLQGVRHWWRQRLIRRSAITPAQWQQAFARLPLLQWLDAQERQALCELAIVFLHRKRVQGVGSVTVSQDMALVIALQACLPILRLDLSWYDGWTSVLVYPGDFSPLRTQVDEAGVVHKYREHLAGEAWQQGPVVLSWNDVYHAGEIDGHNLVIHEFAHKLDMANGVANGFPPLHANMARAEWTDTFSTAFASFQARVRAGHGKLPFDRYGAQSPAEFFAVLSEVFFELPATLTHTYPKVYRLLCDFYRQDPLARQAASGGNVSHAS